MKTALLLGVAAVGLAGCAVEPSCPPSGCTLDCTGRLSLTAYPLAATADHDAAPPGNQQQFTVTEQVTFYHPSGEICTVPTPPPAVVYPAWTNPEPLDISISSANDSTNGLAVCTGATGGAATLTGTVNSSQGEFGLPAQQLSTTVQLTCK